MSNRMKAALVILTVTLSLAPLSRAAALPPEDLGPTDLVHVGAAFLTHLAVHESGHYVVAHMGGADSVDLSFFTQRNGNFFLGLSSAKGVQRESLLSYKMGGEAAASYLFEVALRQYRRQPTVYNTSLLLFSGTDFLWYSFWSFYIEDSNNPSHDPVGIAQETGLSKETIFGMAALQTALNAYRIYSGNDAMTPFIRLDEESAAFGVQVRF